jgi:uncharacterized protein YlxW (UPF0749 family)
MRRTRVVEDIPETWIYSIAGYLGTNGVRYSKKYYTLQRIGDRLMIIGDVAEYGTGSNGMLKVVSARVKPVAEYAGNY